MVSCNGKKIRKSTVPLFIFLAFFALLISSQLVLAGTTGKISGVIKDKSTGDPLPGANVIIEGTNRGAAADANGRYLILHVAPGTYTLRFQMIGYQKLRVENVRVFTDRTTKINAKLLPQAIQGKAVTIVAGREPVEFDRTSTSAYVSKEEIEALPVSNVSELVQMQAGVVSDAGGALHFRGGRSREVAYMIDGMPVSNSFSQGGGSNVAVENNFIQELQVITGTFNAEYGSAQSGVINVITKVPEKTYHASVEAITGGYYAPHEPMYIGLNKYDPLAEKETKFSLSGPVPGMSKIGKLGFFVNGRIVGSKGWLNGQRRFRPKDGWEILVYREWYRAIFDPEDPLLIKIPDSLHTGDGKIIPMNWSNSYNFNVKFVYQPKSSMTLSYNMFHNYSHGKSFSNHWKFCPDGKGQHFNEGTTHMFVFTHVPLKNVFYNIRYSYQSTQSKSFMYESANDPRYQQNAANAWDPGVITGYDMGGFDDWGRNWFDQKIHLTNGDITWQINKIVELKAGYEAKFSRFHYKKAPMREVFGYEELQFPFARKEIEEYDLTYNFFRDSTAHFEHGHVRLREASPDSARDQQFYVNYVRSPREGASYIQTKLEMGEIVLNAGLRLDFYFPRDRYCPDYSKVYPELVGDPRYYIQAKPKWQLSPRFGLSFPISDRGALRLSYGHFFQTPSYEKMYQNPVLPHYNQYSVEGTRIGNPNLKPERTVQYEIGLQQQLTDDISFETTIYRKDMKDLLGIEILTLSNASTFYRYVNKEYGNSSGFTIAFNQGIKNRWVSSRIDYTYMIAKGSASNPEILRDISVVAGPRSGSYNLAIRKINYLDWDQRHTLNASVTIHPTPNMNISAIGQIGSGLPYTPATLDPSIELPGGLWDNQGRKPTRWNVDMMFSQAFHFGNLRVMAMVRAFNVFNHLNENRVHSVTGHAGPDAYLPEVGKKRYYRLKYLGEFTKNEADYDPSWYSRPRLVQFGLQIGF
ncbi:MAG: TonB-dependent receptor [Calditrichaeota bacterium]|nr:TonB-dependent receptor [Calditrichota bacterium]